MSKIINIGDLYVLKSEIAYVCKETTNGKPSIKYLLKGNSISFVITFEDIQARGEKMKEFIEAMEES